jgi:hypothetical protein
MTFLNDPYLLVPWIALIVAELSLCLVLLRNHDQGQRRYPAFRAFIYVATARSVFVFAVAYLGPYSVYWWSHWISEIPMAALRFCVLAELLRQIFHPARAVPPKFTRMFWNTTAAIFVAGAIVAFTVPAPYPDLVMCVAMTSAKTITYVQAATLGLVLIFASRLGVNWRDRAYGISAGLVLEYVTNSAIFMLLSPAPGHSTAILLGLGPFSSFVAVITWLFYFFRPDGNVFALRDNDAVCLVSEPPTEPTSGCPRL